MTQELYVKETMEHNIYRPNPRCSYHIAKNHNFFFLFSPVEIKVLTETISARKVEKLIRDDIESAFLHLFLLGNPLLTFYKMLLKLNKKNEKPKMKCQIFLLFSFTFVYVE